MVTSRGRHDRSEGEASSWRKVCGQQGRRISSARTIPETAGLTLHPDKDTMGRCGICILHGEPEPQLAWCHMQAPRLGENVLVLKWLLQAAWKSQTSFPLLSHCPRKTSSVMPWPPASGVCNLQLQRQPRLSLLTLGLYSLHWRGVCPRCPRSLLHQLLGPNCGWQTTSRLCRNPALEFHYKLPGKEKCISITQTPMVLWHRDSPLDICQISERSA